MGAICCKKVSIVAKNKEHANYIKSPKTSNSKEIDEFDKQATTKVFSFKIQARKKPSSL